MRIWIGPQKGRRRRVVKIETFKQHCGGIGAASTFSTKQVETEITEHVGLRLRRQRLYHLKNLVNRQIGCIGCERCDAKGGHTSSQQ